jgi:hypothetical protein
MNETQEAVKSAIKINKKGIRLSWWLLVLALVVFGGIFAYVTMSKGKTGAGTGTAMKAKVDTIDEIKIKQSLSSLRGDINRFNVEKKTYEGWAPNAAIGQKVKDMKSEIKTVLGKDTYMIYAKMPNSKLIFCMDNNGTPGFTGEVTKVGKKTCK